MCIQTKKNGTPRRVIDLQPVNKHAVRQTHAGESPFQIVADIPLTHIGPLWMPGMGIIVYPLEEKIGMLQYSLHHGADFAIEPHPKGFWRPKMLTIIDLI